MDKMYKSALEIFLSMRYINLHFTYLLTYLHRSKLSPLFFTGQQKGEEGMWRERGMNHKEGEYEEKAKGKRGGWREGREAKEPARKGNLILKVGGELAPDFNSGFGRIEATRLNSAI